MATSLSGPATGSLRLYSAFRTLSHSGCGGGRLHLGRPFRLSPTPPPPRSRRRAPPADTRRGPPTAGRLAVSCGAVTAIGQSEFSAEVLGSDLPVLVEFVADWCGPCRLITPFVEWASQEYKGRLKVVKIDHDANPQLIKEYNVYGLPTLILFKNGQEVPESRREGAITKVKLKEYLDSLLESTTVV